MTRQVPNGPAAADTLDLTRRPFAAGVEGALVELWNRAHAPYGGHVPRTVDYWRWCILERPGVESDDVVILGRDVAPDAAPDAARPLAYGVLGPEGMALELAIDPEIVGAEREAVGARLVEALEERARERGEETIAFELPGNDGPVARTMARAGYRPEGTGSLQLVIVDLAALVEAILARREGRLPHGWSPTFLFEIEPGAYHYCPERRLVVRIGPPAQAIVLEGDGAERAGAATVHDAADCVVRIDLSTLTDLIFNRTGVEEVLASRRLAVEPAAREQDVRTLLNLLVIRSSWYTPHADGR